MREWSNNDLAIMSMTEDDVDRFMSKIEKSEDGCWNWTAAKKHDGYGMFGVGKVTVLVHRIACWLAHGAPLEGRPTVDHLCKNRACVNPNHLRWASSKEQNSFGASDHIKVDDDTAIDCIKRCLSGEMQRKLSRELGIPNQTISRWVLGTRRPELLEEAKRQLA